MRTLCCFLIVLGISARADADEAATSRHLLAGVRAFKAARYEEALVELRIVARAPDAPSDLAFYLGPTLYKLGRYRESIAAFMTSRAPRDALSDFYLGEAYYQQKLFRKAHQVFAALRTRGLGPALDEAAARYVAAVETLYKAAPQPATIDIYIAQAAELAVADPVVAAEVLDEARLVEALAPTRHHHAEILAALGAAWNASGRARSVIDTLGADRALSYDGTWQLARAYTSIGDRAHARPLLEAIASQKSGAHAAEAAAALATLSP